ncbi:hypothetical protein CPB84DRAFT_1784447, partial [Gymnopilus junonius]
MEIGHSLNSCTTELSAVEIGSLFGRSDASGQQLLVILKNIAEWLECMYNNTDVVLGGVIYLHDISSDRFSGTARRNLEMFHNLCGDAALDKVILGTTKWKRKTEEINCSHEDEMKKVHWKPLIKKGSTVCRFLDSHESAKSFIDIILRRMAIDTALQIQVEMAVHHKSVPETKAGKGLRVHQILELQAQIIRLEATIAASSDVETESKLVESRKRMQGLKKEVQDAKVPLPRRIRSLIGLL